MVKGQMSSAGDGSVELHDAEIEAALPAVTRDRRLGGTHIGSPSPSPDPVPQNSGSEVTPSFHI